MKIIKSEGAYLTSRQAADYVGYTAAAGFVFPVRAFMKAARRHQIPMCWIGRRARFLRRDLDEYLQRLRLDVRATA